MNRSPSAAQREAVREAARWYAQLSSGTVSAEDQASWQRWHDSDPLHRQAWQRMQAVSHSFAGLPGRIAASTLLGSGNSRRQVLYGLAMLLGGGVLGTLGWRSDTRRQWYADYRSGVGERRTVRLADGSQMLLDTDSAVDVDFDMQQRRVLLHRGQVLITTARDDAARPFRVDTRHGSVLALGTRFTVSVDDHGSEVAVLEKAVEVSVQPIERLRLHAGQRVAFGPAGIGSLRSNDAAVAAWEQGSVIAVDTPLQTLLAQLARYRPGVLNCDPAVAQMKISGAFPITDTELALTALQSAFPLTVQRRTRYWVTVVART
ncbi:iron dicitrate transport regulator FecR [Pseudomonas putida]|jgi:transmembrane sensor|uniref:FecR domain-containing protein n=1 Tax=Pseudomonas TaxID=286 RepID=UPI0007314555|nr:MULTISPECIES: FecR domain-containing protein [Pseudomonas]KTC22316.1 iron dicitrate transport regulator FecR [Pseudomonas putida]MBG8559372.1 FecR domain-containing protein [Pseudomonas qingdaonensis]